MIESYKIHILSTFFIMLNLLSFYLLNYFQSVLYSETIASYHSTSINLRINPKSFLVGVKP